MGEVVGHHNDFLLEHNPKLDLNPQRLQKELQLTCTPGAKYHPDCMDIFWPQNNRLQMSGQELSPIPQFTANSSNALILGGAVRVGGQKSPKKLSILPLFCPLLFFSSHLSCPGQSGQSWQIWIHL